MPLEAVFPRRSKVTKLVPDRLVGIAVEVAPVPSLHDDAGGFEPRYRTDHSARVDVEEPRDAPKARITSAGLAVVVLDQGRRHPAAVLDEFARKAECLECEKRVERTDWHWAFALQMECASS